MTRMHWIVRAPVLSATLQAGLRLDHESASSGRPASASASALARPARMGGGVDRLGRRRLLGDDLARQRPWSPPRATTATSRQRFVADSGRDSSMRTVSPTRASLASSWALNFVRQADDPLVERVARQALDGHDDRLVHLVADDAADLGLPLALHLGVCSCHRVISLTPSWPSLRSRWTVRIRAIVRRVCGIVL